MTPRIADLASGNALIGYLLKTQSRLHDLEVQVSTEKVSQDYQGIARDSQRLVNIENTRDILDRFVTNNEAMDLRLNTSTTVIEGIRQTISDFREMVFEYESGSLTDEQRVIDIQDAAFRALTDMSVHLNTDVDGRYIFAGSRVTTRPVDFGLSSLSAFQTTYNGEAIIYPPTREAHVETQATYANATHGGLEIVDATTLRATTGGSLSGIPVGSVITLAGFATAGNNTRYTVVSNNGTDIKISGTIDYTGSGGTETLTVTNAFTAVEGPVANATITTDSYYSGDSVAQTHRTATNRDFTLDITAIDPAFEKAIRAMSIIAQGAFGTNGGLDNHPERVDQALYLLNYSLDITSPGAQPFDTEDSSNVRQVDRDIGFYRVLIDQTNERNKELIGFFDQRVAQVENADPLEAISRLLDDSQALEAAYQALARIRELSLGDYLA